jgi:LacI family transcriptional regulator
MVEAGSTPAGDHVRRGSFSPDFARLAVLDILRSKSPPTAIFASSDYLALGAVSALRQAGVDIPRQMSLISFDDTPVGALLTPALTAIRQPIEAIGRAGFQALHAQLNRKTAAKLTRLPVELIERESVATPRKGLL